MGGPSVHVTGVSKTFGRTAALRGVSFTASEGVTGLLGPNGAGKTTLLRILATVLPRDRGELDILGLDPANANERMEIRRRLGYMPQEPGFHRHFTGFEFVDYVAVLKGLTRRRIRHAEVERVLDTVGLGEVAHRRIKSLSGGMRRRVALAQALLGDPRFLILDEPTAGLDPEQRLRFRETLSKLTHDHTILLSTHQTEDVLALCRETVVVHHGTVLFSGAPIELAALGRGHVWLGDAPEPAARLSWRTGEGRFRNIGDAPPGAQLVEPTIEDGYLLLVGAEARSAV